MRRMAFGPALLALAGFLLTVAMFHPGIMTNDSIDQYAQAVDLEFDDWHPPMMAFIWAATNLAVRGPLGMLLLDAALYWVGLYLAARSLQDRRSVATWVLLLAGFMPFLLGTLGHIWKDTLHATIWIFAVGLLVYDARDGRKPRLSGWVGILLLVGTLVRANAIFGLPALAWLWLRTRGVRSIPRLAAGVVASAAACVIVGGLFNYVLLQSHKSAPHQSLMVFDLGGMSHYAGADLFGKSWSAEQSRRIVGECYDGRSWDEYRWGKCSFAGQRLIDDGDWDALRVGKPWVHAIIAHPAAYLEHRATYFAKFLTEPQAVFVGRMEKNPWGFEFRPNRLYDALAAATRAIDSSFVYKPWFWFAASLALASVAMWGPAGGERDVALALGLSGFLYIAAYFFVGVAVDFRYVYWPMVATCAGAVFAAAQWRRARLAVLRLEVLHVGDERLHAFDGHRVVD